MCSSDLTNAGLAAAILQSQNRYDLLKKVHRRFIKKEPEDFSVFCDEEKEWLSDYAEFMALKDAHDGAAWEEWEDALRFREPGAMEEVRDKYAEEICFYKMLQYLFFKQWRSLKEYANQKGIQIIGDVPIYVAGDSADVWANPDQFYLDEDLHPIEVIHLVHSQRIESSQSPHP